MKPKVFFENDIIEEASGSWKDAFVIKVLDKNLGFSYVRERVKVLWRLKGGFDMMLAANHYFTVNFYLLEDRLKVIEGGPWMINGHYLVVKEWSP